jgi:cytochrome c-type biogenesis protein CcmH/NrfG
MVSVAFIALSLALVVLVAGYVLRPLWRDSRGAALGLGAGLLACTAALYLLVGTPTALDPRTTRAPETITDAIAELEAALAREPQLAEGWVLLGRAYRAEGRAVEARDAFARAARLLPDEADVQVEAAEARALAAPDRRIDDEAVAMLDRALELQPRHQRARWFLGIARRQRGEAAEAAAIWESLLADVDARTAASLRPQIDAARAEAGPAAAAGACAGRSRERRHDPGAGDGGTGTGRTHPRRRHPLRGRAAARRPAHAGRGRAPARRRLPARRRARRRRRPDADRAPVAGRAGRGRGPRLALGRRDRAAG